MKEMNPQKDDDLSNYDNSIIVNRIACGDGRYDKDNMDSDFGHMWQGIISGGKVPRREQDPMF